MGNAFRLPLPLPAWLLPVMVGETGLEPVKTFVGGSKITHYSTARTKLGRDEGSRTLTLLDFARGPEPRVSAISPHPETLLQNFGRSEGIRTLPMLPP